MIQDTNGWAVIEDNEIDVATISPNRRSAIVNWLIVHHGIRLTVDTPDNEIERLWAKSHGHAKVMVVDIAVSQAQMQ